MGERWRDVRVVLAEGRFPDGQRALKQRLGPDGVAPEQVMEAERIQARGDVGMGAPEHRLPQRQRLLAPARWRRRTGPPPRACSPRRRPPGPPAAAPPVSPPRPLLRAAQHRTSTANHPSTCRIAPPVGPGRAHFQSGEYRGQSPAPGDAGRAPRGTRKRLPPPLTCSRLQVKVEEYVGLVFFTCSRLQVRAAGGRKVRGCPAGARWPPFRAPPPRRRGRPRRRWSPGGPSPARAG